MILKDKKETNYRSIPFSAAYLYSALERRKITKNSNDDLNRIEKIF